MSIPNLATLIAAGKAAALHTVDKRTEKDREFVMLTSRIHEDALDPKDDYPYITLSDAKLGYATDASGKPFELSKYIKRNAYLPECDEEVAQFKFHTALHNYKVTEDPKHLQYALHFRNELINMYKVKYDMEEALIGARRTKNTWATTRACTTILQPDSKVDLEVAYPKFDKALLTPSVINFLSKNHPEFLRMTAYTQHAYADFLAHIILSTRNQEKVAIPKTFILQNGYRLLGRIHTDEVTGESHIGYDWLETWGYIHASGYTRPSVSKQGKRVQGKCRRWTLTNPSIRDIDTEIQEKVLENIEDHKRVYENATTYYDKKGNIHAITPQAAQAMKVQPMIINITKSKEYLIESKEQAKSSYPNDLRCFNVIYSQVTKQFKDKNGNTYGIYTPKYNLASTGRIQELGGGLQTCSKEMKKAVYYATGIVNIDLKAAQPRILEQTLRSKGFYKEANDVRNYLNQDREQLAKKCKLPVKAFKRTTLLMMFGGVLELRNGRAFEELVSKTHTNYEDRQECLKACKKHLAFLEDAATAYDSIWKAETTIEHTNAMGTVYPKSYTARTRAHFLQGQEADIVRRVPKCANEHDGFLAHTSESKSLLSRNGIKLSLDVLNNSKLEEHLNEQLTKTSTLAALKKLVLADYVEVKEIELGNREEGNRNPLEVSIDIPPYSKEATQGLIGKVRTTKDTLGKVNGVNGVNGINKLKTVNLRGGKDCIGKAKNTKQEATQGSTGKGISAKDTLGRNKQEVGSRKKEVTQGGKKGNRKQEETQGGKMGSRKQGKKEAGKLSRMGSKIAREAKGIKGKLLESIEAMEATIRASDRARITITEALTFTFDFYKLSGEVVSKTVSGFSMLNKELFAA